MVWVANREKALNDSSGTVKISLNGLNVVVWSSNAKNLKNNHTTKARLEEMGNLVLLDETTGETLWQSLDHPCNVALEYMSSGMTASGNVSLTSWKNTSDPSQGNFSAGIYGVDIFELYVWKNFRASGPWNG